ncbi:MAG: DsrE family protein [Dysgonamonadaceae bacterium]|jgi:uncharacterized protein involved in oxidation of intracellular sulfur|nr:DsrE family protein [Dysgonamonadaceae bacterium]
MNHLKILILTGIFLLAACTPKPAGNTDSPESNIELSKSNTMKIGIILETKEPEKAWNAFRFAVTAKKQGHEVKLFLMGEAVECEGLVHEKFNVDEQLQSFAKIGGEILACGTCLRSRQLDGTESCPISTMVDCVEVVEWADKVVTF